MTSIALKSETQDKACPDCGTNIRSHREFPRWCPQCEWNLGSDENRNTSSHTARIYQKIGTSQGESVFQSVLTQDPENLRPRWGTSKILAFALSFTIHLFSIAMAGLGFYALSFGWPAILLMLIGVCLLWLAWSMRPRLGTMPKDCLGRQDAPALFALCDQIADKVGSPRVDGILINGDYNAGFARVGMPRKTLLVIGLPMWLVQTWSERIAILTHEFSHGANGDNTRGMIIGSALDTLEHLMRFLRPEYDPDSSFTQMLMHYLLLAVSLLVELVHIGLSHLVWRQSQIAEFLADYLATTVSGTQAMRDGLQKISYSVHFEMFARRSIIHTQQSGKQVLTKFVSYFRKLPESELERLDRLAHRENARLDATHPPTRQRVAFIATHPVAEAAITVSKNNQELIESELERLEETVGRQMISDWAPER
ncbi:MAG: M48 family metallopeptidase [Halopseudomonas aestusnigri]